MLFDHVDRNAQDDGAALGLRAPERPGGVGETRERVRKAGALMDACDADLSRGAGVAVRHHDRAALVAGGVECRTLRVQSAQDGEVAASGKPEERFDTTVD